MLCPGSAGPAVESAKLIELDDHYTLVKLRLWIRNVFSGYAGDKVMY